MLQGIQRQMTNYIKNDVPRMVPIAPAREPKYMEADNEKRRYNNKSNPYVGAQAASIARRNARERNRVKQVNDGFNALRKRLPPSVIAALSGGARRGSGTKLSKVDTLRMVVEYIKHMQNLIEESDAAMGITKTEKCTNMDTSLSYEDEGIFGGSSPYSESVPSPVNSECSSGVSSVYSSNNGYVSNSYQTHDSVNINEDYFLDTMSWWPQK